MVRSNVFLKKKISLLMREKELEHHKSDILPPPHPLPLATSWVTRYNGVFSGKLAVSFLWYLSSNYIFICTASTLYQEILAKIVYII